jgi:predicted transcriptional regulator
MTILKQTITDKIEIVGQFNHIQVREAIQVLEDGNIISQSYHRYVVAPGETSNDSKVQAIIAAVHTPDVIAAYQQHLQEQSEV